MARPFSAENPLLIKGDSYSLGQHWTLKHGPPNPKTMMPPVIPPSPVDTSVWGNGTYSAINDNKMMELMENEVSDYDKEIYNPRFPQYYSSQLKYDPELVPRFKYPYRPSLAQPSLPEPVPDSSLPQYVEKKQDLKAYKSAWSSFGQPIGVIPEMFGNTLSGIPREGYTHIDNPLKPPVYQKYKHQADDYVYSAPGVIDNLVDRVTELSGVSRERRENYHHIDGLEDSQANYHKISDTNLTSYRGPPSYTLEKPDDVYLPSRSKEMSFEEKDSMISDLSGRAVTSKAQPNPLGPTTRFPTYSPDYDGKPLREGKPPVNYFRDEIKKGLDHRMGQGPSMYGNVETTGMIPNNVANSVKGGPKRVNQAHARVDGSTRDAGQEVERYAHIERYPTAGRFVEPLPPYAKGPPREGYLGSSGPVAPGSPTPSTPSGNNPPQLGMLYDPMLNNELPDPGMFTHSRDTSLPSTLQVEGNDDRFKHSDQFYYRQSQVKPNFMTTNEIIEPINANNGISYLPQRYDLIDEVGPTSLNHYSFTRYDPQLLRQEEDLPYGRAIENPTRTAWTQHLGETMAPPGSIDISQIYDPRFTGYGDGFRAYEDIKSGRLRYYYRNVDAYKYPLFVAKNKVDHLDMYTPTGEVWARYNLDMDKENYKEIVEDQYTQDDLFHREDLMSKQLQPFFRRQWQLRIAPKRPVGTATYGGV